MSRTNALVKIAAQMGLTPVQAIVLPTAVDMAARKVGMSSSAFVAEVKANAGLRAYIAEVCAKVASTEFVA